MTQGDPGGTMPDGSHTFMLEQESPGRHIIVAEQLAPTDPPGGIVTSTGPSVGSPPSFDVPPAPPPPIPPVPTLVEPASKSTGAVTALELLQAASAPAERIATQP